MVARMRCHRLRHKSAFVPRASFRHHADVPLQTTTGAPWPLTQIPPAEVSAVWLQRAQVTSNHLVALGSWVGDITRLTAADLSHPAFHADLQFLAARNFALTQFLVETFLDEMQLDATALTGKSETEKDLFRLLAIVKVRADDALQEKILEKLSLSARPSARAALIAQLNALNAAIGQELGKTKTSAWFAEKPSKQNSSPAFAPGQAMVGFPKTQFEKPHEMVEQFHRNVSKFAEAAREGQAEILTLVAMGAFGIVFPWLTGWGAWMSALGPALFLFGGLKGLVLWARRSVIGQVQPHLRFDRYSQTLSSGLDFYFQRCQLREKQLHVVQHWIKALDEAKPLSENMPSLFQFEGETQVLVSLDGLNFLFSNDGYLQMRENLQTLATHLEELIAAGLQVAEDLAKPLPHKKIKKSWRDFYIRCEQDRESSAHNTLDSLLSEPERHWESGLAKWLQSQVASGAMQADDAATQTPQWATWMATQRIARLRQQIALSFHALKVQISEYDQYFGFHPRAAMPALQHQFNALAADVEAAGIFQSAAFWNDHLKNINPSETVTALLTLLQSIHHLTAVLDSKLSLARTAKVHARDRGFYTRMIEQYFE